MVLSNMIHRNCSLIILVPMVLILCCSRQSANAFSLSTTKTTRHSQHHVSRRPLTNTRLSNNRADGTGDGDDETWLQVDSSEEDSLVDRKRRDLIYNTIAVGLIGASGVASLSLFQTSVYTPKGFTRLPRTQFIAALGDPKSSSGTNAKEWGVWSLDPGPRGVWLKDYQKSLANQPDQRAPAGWTFNPNDWWLEEHGLIMEQPYFPLPAGRYLVTGGRLVTTGLTIHPDGSWKLDDGRTLYDVTHLPCRSARYTLALEGSSLVGSPLTANPRDFPVAPGAIMPSVPGCHKQDYAVLFVVGKEQLQT